MIKKKLLILGVAAAVTLSAAGAAAWWWFAHAPQAAQGAQAAKPQDEKGEYKYVRLDKVFVMLRSSEGGNFATPLAVDLVFKVPAKEAAKIKEDLPFLQAVAHRALAEKTRSELTAMTSDQLADLLDKAFLKAYVPEQRDRPFKAVMIGKLIVE